uniref:Uncharacterized protein n=1 Tax=Anguilla anguilla TaxID=7936 RepID=A0A0E9X1A7_ANGAN
MTAGFADVFRGEIRAERVWREPNRSWIRPLFFFLSFFSNEKDLKEDTDDQSVTRSEGRARGGRFPYNSFHSIGNGLRAKRRALVPPL